MDDALECDLLSTVVGGFAHFVRFQLPNKQFVTGAEALTHMYKDCVAKKAKGEVTLQGISPLRVFHWLVAEDIQEDVEKLAKEISSEASHALQVVRGPKSSSAAAKAKAPKKTDMALNKALDMFK